MLDLRTLEGIGLTRKLLVISDEVYQYILFDGNGISAFLKLTDRQTVVIDSWSNRMH